jgi:hypothetical protein
MLSSIQKLSTALPAPADSELVLLERLCSLLDDAMGALVASKALPLQEVSRQITMTADELTRLMLQISRLPLSVEARQRRQEILTTLCEQHRFCRAMLRRWRRSVALRQQMLALNAEPLLYTESLALHVEQR